MKGYVEELDKILLDVPATNDASNNVSSTPSSGQTTDQSENVEQFGETTVETTQDVLAEFAHNPVCYLQDYCVKKKLETPTYGIEQQDGPAHNFTFHMFCQVGEVKRVAQSKKKKDGKALAAFEVIKYLKSIEKELPENETSTGTETVIEKPSKDAVNAARTVNYVGYLQELCVAKNLPPPIYDADKCTVTANNPSFYISCEVGKHKEIGNANTKKNAKQLAAEKIVGLLQTLSTESVENGITQTDSNEDSHQTVTAEYLIKTLSVNIPVALSEIPNPVGYLHELCVKKRVSAPTYNVVKMEGFSHCPIFTMSCKIGELYEEATANNKKLTKELAARQILMHLKNGKSVSNETCNSVTNETSKSVSNETSNMVSNETSNLVSNETSNLVSNETSNLVSNETSNLVSNETSNLVSNETSNLVSNETSNLTSNETSNLTSNETSNSSSNETSNLSSNETSTPPFWNETPNSVSNAMPNSIWSENPDSVSTETSSAFWNEASHSVSNETY